MSNNEDDDILKEFLVESYENLDSLDREFVALEQEPTARERIAAVFRTIHTIKGTAGFLGYSKLESLAHAGESLLTLLRDGTLALTPEITSGLLATVDGVREILGHVERAGDEGNTDWSSLIARIVDLQRVDGASAPEPAQRPSPEAHLVEPSSAPAPRSHAPEAPQALAELAPSEPEVAAASAQKTPLKVDALVDQRDGRPVEAAAESRSAASDASIRVDVGLLDKLMNLVGELVLARNQILQFGVSAKDTAFIGTTQRLNLITTELQEGVMKTRMMPIGNIWSKFPRVVRDLAVACHKQAALEMEGAETELDRSIIEGIKDPLTHVVRNAVDHGIESAETRIANGKPAQGTLKLRAFHEGGKVNIEISDDGAGIDPDKVRAKAVSRGLVTPERAARMTEREVLNLIFIPGFSTAEKVSSVSGRGVGMDVVKTNVEKIGGTVDVSSKVGHGTSLKIKIPLTLAIIPALVVTSRGERYAIPQVNLLELVRLNGEQAVLGVETIHGAPVYRLRGNLLPLVYLDSALASPPNEGSSTDVNIVVLQADDRQFGLVVDSVLDTEEIVVKPLGKELKSITAFAGATIMGDGRVALILDVLGIAQRSNVISAVRERSLQEKLSEVQARGEPKESMLLFTIRGDDRMAVPLAMVARLEEFSKELLERIGDREVVQYRGQIMPLVPLDDILGGAGDASAADEPLQVIVTNQGGVVIGLVVNRILDIVEEAVTVRTSTGMRDGVIGAAVLQGHVTELLDVKAVLRRFDPSLARSAA